MSAATTAVLLLVLPLASAAIIALFLRRRGGAAAAVSIGTCAVLAAAGLCLAFSGERGFPASWEWLRLGDFSVSISLLFDDLAAMMAAVVAVVGLCIHVFSAGYMREDPARGRYFAGLSVFMFSMLGIVLAGNLFMMFFFWELVGFSSWLLINHHHERDSASDAARKAFIVNRIGDAGFLAGIIWCWHAFGTVDLAAMRAAGPAAGAAATAIPLLLFCGAAAKSAQMPLHVWLPDAMEGPTPVSALIHAATMVAAGVYMLCRVSFLMTPGALQVICWTGTATALFPALFAVAQNDIKKVLAYSTLSQLGYMVAAFGLGALGAQAGDGGRAALTAGAAAAMFHLMTHAFFKALLFLGAGSVIHACRHEQDIFRMGGLRRRMPVTFLTFTAGVLALAGCPLFAGFFSKDAILLLALRNNPAVFAVLALAVLLTAFYMTRLWRTVFLGEPHSEHAAGARESGPVMTVPLLVLAALAVAGGYGIYGGAFDGVLELVPHAAGAAQYTVAAVGVVAMLCGVLAAWFLCPAGGGADALAERAPRLMALLSARLWFDEAYLFYVRRVQDPFAGILHALEQIFISGIAVRGLAGLAGLAGYGARMLHTGNIQACAWWFFIGLLLLWGFAAGFLH